MHDEGDKGKDFEMDLSEENLEDAEEVFEITPDDPLHSKIEEACEKSEDLLDRLQRLQAEFDNYRKRMDNRFSEVTKFASEDIILKILDVYDNILRALEMDFTKNPTAAKTGVEAIQRQLDIMLSKEDVRPIESVGKTFDPYYQHAAQRIVDSEKPDGIILEEYQKGYMLKDRVLRPAVVCVNRHEVQPVEESSDEDKNSKLENNGE
ncbi:MAG: nucleotide exchange factor GrpE [Candidatus Thorarchaeota archaeon]|nr:MAG: nucleotide exchange factor GrpE [Candidatus Thorarchaeota archaeon]